MDQSPFKRPVATFPTKYLMHRGRQSESYEGAPAIVRFNYEFKSPFNQLVMSQMLKHNWESRSTLTTIADVEQIDEDTIVYHRRQENAKSTQLGWDRVTVNRSTGQMTVDSLHPNTDGSTGVM